MGRYLQLLWLNGPLPGQLKIEIQIIILILNDLIMPLLGVLFLD